jgi:hypothetical protein
MSGFKLAEVSGNLLTTTTWERLAKYFVINLAVSIVLTILIFLTLAIFGRCSLGLSMFIILCLILSGHAVVLSWYEHWRGCNIQM